MTNLSYYTIPEPAGQGRRLASRPRPRRPDRFGVGGTVTFVRKVVRST
jgi:hypothetical protein